MRKFKVLVTSLYLIRKKVHSAGDVITEADFGFEPGQRDKAIEERLKGKYVEEITDGEASTEDTENKGGNTDDTNGDENKGGDDQGGSGIDQGNGDSNASDLPRKEIREQLDSKGIKYNKNAPTKELYDLLMKSK